MAGWLRVTAFPPEWNQRVAAALEGALASLGRKAEAAS